MSFRGGVKWRIDNRPRVLAQLRDDQVDALADAGEHLLEHANRTVPIEEGTLARSAKSTVVKSERAVVVSYDTPYAVPQHENTTLHHDEGRRAKWLERTVQEQRDELLEVMASRLRKGFA